MSIRGLLVIILLVSGYFLIRRLRRSSRNQRWRRLFARLSRILWTGQRLPPAVSPGSMSRKEAYAILGLPMGASRDEIQRAYRRLIQRVHPDQGGSTDLAARLNQARDALLG